jgi:hypothetical protein
MAGNDSKKLYDRVEKLIRASEKRQGLFGIGSVALTSSIAFVLYGAQQNELSIMFSGVFLWLVATVLFIWAGWFSKRA